MKSVADTAAGVAVPARRADRLGSNQHSRSNDLPALDGVPQADVDKVARSEVADSGKAGHQRLSQILGCVERHFRDRLALAIHEALPVVLTVAMGKVSMRVDQAGQQ